MSSHPRQADLRALLEGLVTNEVDFIVVGGAAAVLHGAPITTQDLDIVHSQSRESVGRLFDLLVELLQTGTNHHWARKA